MWIIIFACIYIYIYTHGGPWFIVSSKGLFVESAQNVTGEISEHAQSLDVIVTHPFGDHT